MVYGSYTLEYNCHIASYPGHSQLFNATLKSWEWPGDKAIIYHGLPLTQDASYKERVIYLNSV